MRSRRLATVTLVGFCLFSVASTQADPTPTIVSPRNSTPLDHPAAVVVSGPEVQLVVQDLEGPTDFERVRFLFHDGIGWVLFAEDDDPSNVFDRFPNSHISTGSPIWSAAWDVGILPEGFHSIRVEAVGTDGSEGSSERQFLLDRTPPLLSFADIDYGQEVAGLVPFEATTDDEDVVAGALDVYVASRGAATQDGVGNLRQKNVGGKKNKGGKMFCAPTAAANGLQRLNRVDGRVFGTNTSGQPNTANEVADEMAGDMKTDPTDGTKGSYTSGAFDGTGGDIKAGLVRFLERRGIGCNNTTTGYNVSVQTKPTFEQYDAQIRTGQMVLLSTGKSASGGVLKGGHVMTGTGAQPKGMGRDDFGAFRDPATGASTGPAAWTDNASSGFAKVEYEKDGETESRFILEMIYVCPKDDSVAQPTGDPTRPHEVRNVSTGPTSSGQQEYGVWDTTEVHDGYFVLRATATDATDATGTAFVMVYVNNVAPEPFVRGCLPAEDTGSQFGEPDCVEVPLDVVTEPVELRVGDLLESEDASIVSFTLHPLPAGPPIPVGEDDNPIDGLAVLLDPAVVPPGPARIEALVTDAGGFTGIGEIEVVIAAP